MYGETFFKGKNIKFHKVDIKIPDYVDYLPNYNRDRYYVPEWIVDGTDTKMNFELMLAKKMKDVL